MGRREAAEVGSTTTRRSPASTPSSRSSGGDCTIVDDGLSRNGSYVNGERVRGRKRLRDSDVLRFGQSLVLFRAPGTGSAESTVIAADPLEATGVSPAQKRVLIALCRPYKDGAAFATPATNGQIAEELHLSVDAVKTHLRALFEKFGVGDVPQNQKRVALVERALQSGMVAAGSSGGLGLACDVRDRAAVGVAHGCGLSSAGRSLTSSSRTPVSGRTGSFLELDPEHLEAMIDVNLKGTLYTAAATLPHLIEAGGGDFISLASIGQFSAPFPARRSTTRRNSASWASRARSTTSCATSSPDA